MLNAGHLAKRERHRMINALAEAFAIDVMPFNSIDERINAVVNEIDFEFDAAYRAGCALLQCV